MNDATLYQLKVGDTNKRQRIGFIAKPREIIIVAEDGRKPGNIFLQAATKTVEENGKFKDVDTDDYFLLVNLCEGDGQSRLDKDVLFVSNA